MLVSFLLTAVAFVGTARRQLGKKNGQKEVKISQSQQHNFENWPTKSCYFVEPLFSFCPSRPYLFIKFEKLFPLYSNRFVSSNNNGRTLEQAEAEAAVTVACSDNKGLPRPPISLMDLRDALQVRFSCDLPSYFRVLVGPEKAF